ncbi:MAG: helix-hairpin-helix domain-containing protein, partial [Patescibacteria group bacterium]
KLVKEIQDHRKVTLPRFIYALGIRHIGAENALVLARHFKTFEKLREATLEELDSIEGVGDVVAKAIHEFFHSKDEMAKVNHILEFVHVERETSEAVHGRLSGTTWVFTGTLDSVARDDAKEMVRKLGADVSESVSRKTTYVVVGADPGSKADKAKELGVTMLDEKEFLKMVK